MPSFLPCLVARSLPEEDTEERDNINGGDGHDGRGGGMREMP